MRGRVLTDASLPAIGVSVGLRGGRRLPPSMRFPLDFYIEDLAGERVPNRGDIKRKMARMMAFLANKAASRRAAGDENGSRLVRDDMACLAVLVDMAGIK